MLCDLNWRRLRIASVSEARFEKAEEGVGDGHAVGTDSVIEGFSGDMTDTRTGAWKAESQSASTVSHNPAVVLDDSMSDEYSRDIESKVKNLEKPGDAMSGGYSGDIESNLGDLVERPDDSMSSNGNSGDIISDPRETVRPEDSESSRDSGDTESDLRNPMNSNSGYSSVVPRHSNSKKRNGVDEVESSVGFGGVKLRTDSMEWDSGNILDSASKRLRVKLASSFAGKIYPTHKKRIQKLPERFVAMTAMDAEPTFPKTYREAMALNDREYWLEAMNEEIQSLNSHQTWELVDLPKNAKVLGTRWVLTIKKDAEGFLSRYKARLVAQGFAQIQGVNVWETYAPVANAPYVRFLLAFANSNGYEVDQIDVSTAFLYGSIEEEIYVRQPPGFEDPKNPEKVCKLKRSLYGLKQAPRVWHEHLTKSLEALGYKKLVSDNSIFVKKFGENVDIIVIYVDDILLLSRNKNRNKEIIRKLRKKYKLREETSKNLYLGMKITRENGILSISHEQKILELLKEFRLEKCKVAATPMESNFNHLVYLDHVSTDQTAQYTDVKLQARYQSLIGSLLYIANMTRPDISFAVGLLCRYVQKPKKLHWIAALRVLRYLKGTLKLVLTFDANKDNLLSVGYTDSDFGGCQITRKSTSGMCFMYSGGAIMWSSRKQPVIAQSTAEAEYVAISEGLKWGIALKQLCGELGLFNLSGVVKLFCDNQSAMAIGNNDSSLGRIKHIDIRYHFIKDMIAKGMLKLEFIQSGEMIADIFTKPLARVSFEKHRDALGLKLWK